MRYAQILSSLLRKHRSPPRPPQRSKSLFASRKKQAKNWEFLIPNFWLGFSAKGVNAQGKLYLCQKANIQTSPLRLAFARHLSQRARLCKRSHAYSHIIKYKPACFFAEKTPQKLVTVLPIFRLSFPRRKEGFRPLRRSTGVSPPAHDKPSARLERNF